MKIRFLPCMTRVARVHPWALGSDRDGGACTTTIIYFVFLVDGDASPLRRSTLSLQEEGEE